MSVSITFLKAKIRYGQQQWEKLMANPKNGWLTETNYWVDYINTYEQQLEQLKKVA